MTRRIMKEFGELQKNTEGWFTLETYENNMYEWKIANCYVGLLVEDTGDGVSNNAPLYAESYVLQRRINSFFK